MKYDLFLFDLDDTLLDFKASEQLSFYLSLQSLGISTRLDDLYQKYQIVNAALWKEFEEARTTKDHLKVERFRRILAEDYPSLNPAVVSQRYLDALPETVVLVDHALEICQWLSQFGEIGIITNGIHEVQTKRIRNSQLAPYISFVSVSEACGFAKPDVRFFEYTSKMARNFSKRTSIIIGDRLEADIKGSLNFGIDSCWFNPNQLPGLPELQPTFEIAHLSEIKVLFTRRPVHT